MQTGSPCLFAQKLSPLRRRISYLLCGIALGCGKSAPEQLPPLGEVIISIDTDAPVPAFVSRLRVDLYDEQGTWFDSRDISRPRPANWPASFSVFSRDESRPQTVLVRARGYLEGRTRDYRGERFQDRLPYVEPKVAGTLSELCDARMPQLELGSSLTLRRGTDTLTQYIPEQPPPDAPADWVPECRHTLAGGAVAARLVIDEPGEYRIETTNVSPSWPAGGDVNLFIRTICSDAASQVACDDDIEPIKDVDFISGRLARITTQLEPGSYTVLASGYFETPADITLRAALAADWDSMEPVEVPSVGTEPRLLRDGVDATPEVEPQPLVTIDRLARLSVVPGETKIANLVLRTACSGQMAKLNAAGAAAPPVLGEAETCVDVEGERAPLIDETEAFSGSLPTAGLAGTFQVGEPCPDETMPNDRVCIPPGPFVLGDASEEQSNEESRAPERFAMLNRFWIDRTEVTVGRFRAAVARGFASPTSTPVANDEPLATQGDELYLNRKQHCTYSTSAAPAGEDREEYPLTCVDWYAARAFCQFEGGDLPSEAQWQYVAGKAGRDYEARFPWGDQADAPTCDQAVFSREDPIRAPGYAPSIYACASEGYGPLPVLHPAGDNDVSPLGVRGLAGNVYEWVLDAFYAYDAGCWPAATLVDPLCWEEHAPTRADMGGGWNYPPTYLASSTRAGSDPMGSVDPEDFTVAYGPYDGGFRCVYPRAAP